MKQAKKWTALMLAFTMAAGLAGCGSKDGDSGENNPGEGGKEPVTIEFASWYAAEETTAETTYAMIEAFEEKVRIH